MCASAQSGPALRRIPVAILATSAEQDVLRVYDLQAHCYVTKNVGLEQFVTFVQSIESFCLTMITISPT